MALKDLVEVTVVAGKEMHVSKYGVTSKTTGDGTLTVKIPKHEQKLLYDYGVIVEAP